MEDLPDDAALADITITPKAIDAVIRQDASEIGDEGLTILTALVREKLGIIPLVRLGPSSEPGMDLYHVVGGLGTPSGCAYEVLPIVPETLPVPG